MAWQEFAVHPTDAGKWSARMYIDQALANGAELIDKAKVKRVVIEDNVAIGVEFIKNRNEKKKLLRG
jgi:hypothetical protein